MAEHLSRFAKQVAAPSVRVRVAPQLIYPGISRDAAAGIPRSPLNSPPRSEAALDPSFGPDFCAPDRLLMKVAKALRVDFPRLARMRATGGHLSVRDAVRFLCGGRDRVPDGATTHHALHVRRR